MGSSTGIVIDLITLMLQRVGYHVSNNEDVEKALKGILISSTILVTIVVIYLSYACSPQTSHKLDQTLPRKLTNTSGSAATAGAEALAQAGANVGAIQCLEGEVAANAAATKGLTGVIAANDNQLTCFL